MDITVLQQKLSQQHHLLPSQQELLSRLLFQLAFNDFQNIGLAGAEGSGKSTLALALAELFSEQANVALLTAPLSESELEAQLLQHWFGQREAEPSLAQLMAQPIANALPLLLITDNFDQLSNGARQKLLQLDCLSFFMLAQPSTEMALNLSLNAPTLQDAGHILKDKLLDPLAVAERFAASAGNMHLLHTAVVKPEEQKSHNAVMWLLPVAIVLLLLTALISWYLPTTDKLPAPTATPLTELAPLPTPESVSSPELVNSAEPVVRDNSTELATASEPVAISELSERPEPMTIAALAEAAGLIDTSELVAIPAVITAVEPLVEPLPDAAPAVVSDSVKELTGAAAQLYNEQQLLNLQPEDKVLQLAVLSTEQALQRFVQAYPDTEIAVYQRSWQGQLQWVILTKDHYADLSSARQARSALAEPLRSAGPFIKPVVQVQQEIKALARLRAEPVLQE